MDAAAGRTAKFMNVDLSDITVARAVSDVDFATVAMLRANGYARTLRLQDPKVIRWVDVADRNGSAFTLIAFDASKRPVGTVRLQDSRKGTLELQRFIDLGRVLPYNERPAVQVSRLSALRGRQSSSVLVALFRAAWLWCLAEGIRSMVVAVPRRSRHLYEYMHFAETGPEGEFRHAFAGTLPHITLRLGVQQVEAQMRQGRHPLSGEFHKISERLGLNN